MAITAQITIASYIRFTNQAGVPIGGRAYQNYFLEETRTWEGVSYPFAPFAIDGAQVSSALSNSSAVVIMPTNLITKAVAAEAALGRWLLELKYVVLTPAAGSPEPVWTETSTLSTDLWVCTGLSDSSSDQVVQLELASPLDAVEARTPNCILLDWEVGSLPFTGNVLLS